MSVVISDRVWQSNLKPALKPYAAAWASHAKGNGARVWPSVVRIAWMVGVKVRAAASATSKLRALGVLVVIAERPGRPTIYHFNADALPERRPLNLCQLELQFSTDVHRLSTAPPLSPTTGAHVAHDGGSVMKGYVQKKPTAKKPADAVASPQLLYKLVRTVRRENPDDRGPDLTEAVKQRLTDEHITWRPDDLWAALEDVESPRSRAFWQAQHR